jgi:hypothetical protein
MGPTVPELVSVLEPFVRRNEDGSFVAPKDEALSDLITLAVSMQKTLASLPQQTAEPVIEAARELIASRLDTFRAGNNRRVGIQDQSGEKMWIVPFDEMAALERALEALND